MPSIQGWRSQESRGGRFRKGGGAGTTAEKIFGAAVDFGEPGVSLRRAEGLVREVRARLEQRAAQSRARLAAIETEREDLLTRQ
jgi:hypothetical protein